MGQIHYGADSQWKVFSCEFCKIFKSTFWQNTSAWLLLNLGSFIKILQSILELQKRSLSYTPPDLPQLHPSQPAQKVKKVLKLESEAAARGVLWKKVFIKNSQI